MSIYNALYGRDGHGVGPNEPEKKGFARFCQMVGRDLGQLLGTNLMVCVLCLPAALGVSLGVTGTSQHCFTNNDRKPLRLPRQNPELHQLFLSLLES